MHRQGIRMILKWTARNARRFSGVYARAFELKKKSKIPDYLEDKLMMNYCMEGGTKLELRHLENEGEIPFCSQCNQFRFPIFNTAVSMIRIDVKNQKILLIKQYGRPDYILVAGYISRGEDAEAAVKREVFEENRYDGGSFAVQ